MSLVPDVLWWKLDEGSGTTAADSSGSGRTGTVSTGTTWTKAINGGGALLDGSHSVSCSPITTLTDNLTMSVWLKYDGSSTNATFAYNGNSGANGWGMSFASSACSASNKIGIIIGGNSCNILTSTYTPPTNVWTNLVITRASTWKLWVNGTLNNTGPTTNPSTPNSTFIMTNEGIADVRVYSRALSADELVGLFNQGISTGGMHAE